MKDSPEEAGTPVAALDTATNRHVNLTTINDAQAATEKEHTMSLLEGVKQYPRAIGWSILFSTALVMEGYDVVLMSSLYGNPAFQRKYGDLQPDGSYELSAQWQSGLSNAMNAGQVIGLFINGIVADRYGYRKVMLASLALTTAFVSILFFAPDKKTLLIGELMMGMPLGVFQTLSVTYASEVCPVVLRAYLTTYVNACWVLGQLIASGVLRAFLEREDQWAYRIPFGLQWMWPIPLIIGTYLAPESPWWLVRQGRNEDAKKSLRRLAGVNEKLTEDETVAMMVHTNELEKELESGTTYLDCFKGANLRRTEIVCFTWASQNLCGAGLMGYSTYFYIQAGLAREMSFNMSLAQYGLGLMGTILSWVLMSHMGRRTLFVGGLASLFVCLMIVGFISLAPMNSASSWGTGSMLLVYTFFYDSTVGPVVYSLVSELSSTRLRAKSVVLARNLYNLFSIANGVVFPYMLNPTAWNWKGKTGFFWAGTCFLCLCWAFFRLPEPKGRTYGELDVLFETGVSARKFKTTKVDPFHGSGVAVEKAEVMEEHQEHKI